MGGRKKAAALKYQENLIAPVVTASEWDILLIKLLKKQKKMLFQ